MIQDTGSRFYRPLLTLEEQQTALNVSPLFLAYLQTKIEAYADAVVTSNLPYDPDPGKQMKVFLEFERLKNYVSAYEELFSEITNQLTNQE